MSSLAEQLLRDALKLADEERATLVVKLLDSLGKDFPGDGRTDEEWIAEIERRTRAALAGSPSLNWDDARAQVKDRIGSR
jgi:hypothetical protein